MLFPFDINDGEDNFPLELNHNINFWAVLPFITGCDRPETVLNFSIPVSFLAPEGDAAWASCSVKRRDALKRKIEQRPSKQKLVTQHILLSGMVKR